MLSPDIFTFSPRRDETGSNFYIGIEADLQFGKTLANELIEAKQNGQVKRLMQRWMRYDLIALDEVGYVSLADIGAEFRFQVISDRAERAALIVTTNRKRILPVQTDFGGKEQEVTSTGTPPRVGHPDVRFA